MKPDWSALAPEFTLRPQQIAALDSIYEAMYVNDCDVVTLEAPTGVGKSLIELVLCRYVASQDGSSYIVTPQKTLQDQLARLPGVRPMKGRGSYPCGLVPGLNAAQAPCMRSKSMRDSNLECSDTNCAYFSALKLAKETSIVCHNYASLIAQTHIGGHFGQRTLICLDEGHTASGWIRNYMSLELTTSDLASLTTEDPPDDADAFMPWFRRVLADIGEIPDGVPDRIVTTLMRVLSHRSVYGVPENLFEQYVAAMTGVEDAPKYEDWALEKLADPKVAVTPWHTAVSQDGSDNKYTCTPIRVAPMANVLTGLGSKVLIVTATVLDSDLLLKELGLSSRSTAEVMIDSAFDPDNRPIRTNYVGSMSYNSARATTPKLIDELVRIATYHGTEAGIIHTVSHALAYDVKRMLSDRITGRTIVQMPREGRDTVIERFLSGWYGPNAILIGPGLMEGIDAKDDSARWQAMCKVPWPHRKDPVVSWFLDDPNPRAKRHGERWYTWKTAQACIQGIGRVCRTPNDYGITYLLDDGFRKVLSSPFVPKYVTDAIITR